MKEKIKVAFQGEKGAYSHLACLEVFPDVEAKACSTFEDAFQLAKDDSEYKIKRLLALQELAALEELEVNDDELNTKIEILMTGNRAAPERKAMRKYFSSVSGRENLHQSLLEQKTLEHLAQLVSGDVPGSTEDLGNNKSE